VCILSSSPLIPGKRHTVAQRVVTRLVDDITGKQIADGEGETIQFAFGGYTYEIDLDPKNARKFNETMSFYVDHGRRTGKTSSAPLRRSGGSGKATRGSSEIDNSDVRVWAADNGYTVSPRGRIKSEIIEAYRAAHR
jgi:nucleoid-associated protein Lsr2